MGRKKKVREEEVETTVECLDCGKKYFSLTEASKDHTPDTAATHRIKPVQTKDPVKGARPVHEGGFINQDDMGVGTPIDSNGREDALASLIRKYPQLVNPDARELTRGLDLVEQADRNLVQAKRTVTPIASKPIPSFKKARTMTDASLKESLPHIPNCVRPNVKVARGEELIVISCLTCGCKVELSEG